jgi:hypothetical protein
LGAAAFGAGVSVTSAGGAASAASDLAALAALAAARISAVDIFLFSAMPRLNAQGRRWPPIDRGRIAAVALRGTKIRCSFKSQIEPNTILHAVILARQSTNPIAHPISRS